MNTELRQRVVYPVLIPVLAILLTEVIVFSLSRVFLAAGHTEAAVIALAVALGILVGAAMIASRPRMRSESIAGLMVVLGIGAVAAGAYAMVQGPSYERQAGEGDLAWIQVTSADLDFDTDTLEIPSTGAVIEYANDDSQPHNISIYPSEDETSAAAALFQGQIIQGGERIDYEIGPLDPGTYYFHCDVHPQMEGSVVVEEGAGGAGPEGAH